LVGKFAVRDELRVHVDKRVRSKARCQHIGIGLRQFLAGRSDIEIGGHHLLDGCIEREAVGWSLIVDHRGVDCTDRQDVRQGGCPRRHRQ
jgi:hypothetical protein